MLNELYDKTKSFAQGVAIDEAMSIAQMRANISSPDIRPGLFDGTVDGWLARISHWGKLNITWNNPESWGKKKLTKEQLVKHLINPHLNKAFGQYKTERKDVNKLLIYRDYIGLNGKRYTDKFIIKIDLKPELKKAMK